MSALDLATSMKMAQHAEEKASKQSSRFRLIADPSISVSQIQSVLQKFCEFKQEKQLWTLICPPPAGPLSYGWHSKPDGQWLMKVSSLLYDLLLVCPNTKLVSKKVVAALKAMSSTGMAEFPHTKHLSSADLMDKVDVTLRVLLSTMRQLKCSMPLKAKTCRMMSRAEQCRLEIMLERVVLPAELIGEDYYFDEDERLEADIQMSSVDEVVQGSEVAASCKSLQLVPVEKQQEKLQPSRSFSALGLTSAVRSVNPLPAVFGKLLGLPDTNSAQVGVSQPAQSGKSVLEMAMNHAPKASLKEQKMGQSKKNTKNVQKNSVSKVKKNKCEKKKGQEAKSVQQKEKKKNVKSSKADSTKPCSSIVTSSDTLTCRPGEMVTHRERWVKEQMEHGSLTKRDAMKLWLTSLRRAELLKDLSVSELVKRRFIPSGSKTNPFVEQVQRALEATNVD
eukprot:s3931_g10.t1